MNRTTKQVAYGAFYAAFWFVVLYGGYVLTLRAPASCVDGTRNRDEVEVDCGGAYCQSCDIKRLLPIEFGELQLLPSAAGTTALVEIRNPNAAYGVPRFDYTVQFIGANDAVLYSERDTTLVYPAEVKYRLAVNAPVAKRDIVRAVAVPSADYTWSSITAFARPKTPLRDVRMEYRAATDRMVVTGLVKNDNPFAIRRITLNALISDVDGVLVGISKTIVQDLIAAEERFFQIDVPLSEPVPVDMLASPRVTVDAER